MSGRWNEGRGGYRGPHSPRDARFAPYRSRERDVHDPRDRRSSGDRRTSDSGRPYGRYERRRTPRDDREDRKRPRSHSPRRGSKRSAESGRHRSPESSREEVEALLPFDQALRCFAEHRVRNPRHQSLLSDLLASVNVSGSFPTSFLTTPANSTIDKDASPIIVSTPPPTFAGSPEAGEVMVRVVLPVSQPTKSSAAPLRNYEMLCAAKVTLSRPDNRNPFFYGGPVPEGSDYIKEAKRLLKEQSGMDLSDVEWHTLCELKYTRDGESFTKTVCVGPDTTQCADNIKPVPLAEEKSEEVTEMVDVEYEEEEEVEEDGEKVTKTVKKTKQEERKSTKTTAHTLLQPVTVPFYLFASTGGPGGLAENTLESIAIFDVLDEMCRAASFKVIVEFLQEKLENTEKIKAEQEAEKAVESEYRANLKALAERRAKEIEEREAKMQAAWEEEDEGKTDEERQEQAPERKKKIDEMKKEVSEAIAAERKELEEQRKASMRRTVDNVHEKAKEAFQFLSRGKHRDLAPTGGVSYQYLLQGILALRSDLTEGEVAKMLEPCRSHSTIHYDDVCRLKSMELVHKPKSEEDGKEAEGKETEEKEEGQEEERKEDDVEMADEGDDMPQDDDLPEAEEMEGTGNP
eukprot:Sspe_Gene.54722::Locus_30170_Transcript_1_1_Confidence_1.000_Length_1933::g.54722::m.54722